MSKEMVKSKEMKYLVGFTCRQFFGGPSTVGPVENHPLASRGCASRLFSCGRPQSCPRFYTCGICRASRIVLVSLHLNVVLYDFPTVGHSDRRNLLYKGRISISKNCKSEMFVEHLQNSIVSECANAVGRANPVAPTVFPCFSLAAFSKLCFMFLILYAVPFAASLYLTIEMRNLYLCKLAIVTQVRECLSKYWGFRILRHSF